MERTAYEIAQRVIEGMNRADTLFRSAMLRKMGADPSTILLIDKLPLDVLEDVEWHLEAEGFLPSH